MSKNKRNMALFIGICMVLIGTVITVMYQKKVIVPRNKQNLYTTEMNMSDTQYQTTEQSSIGEQDGMIQESREENEKEKKKTNEQQHSDTEAAVVKDPKAKVLEQYQKLGVVREDVNYLNIREMPTTDSLIIGKMPKYCGMNVLDTIGDWYYVQSGDVVGYVGAEFIVTGKEAEQLAILHCKKMLQVIPEMLDVHKQPSKDSAVWTKLNQNERYIVKDQVDGWYLLDFNSEDAYVPENDVIVDYYLPQAEGWTSVTNCSKPRKELIEYGMQYLGVPYVWGGTDFATGVDCSGFTLLCYNHIGIELPRTSYNQVNRGTLVSLEDAKPGDLMFYTDGEGVVNHVAIYIGDGKILQSANSLHQVTISAYNYNTEPYAIKNIIGD
ncbi:MAG: C40 family peptidase [Clostridiales bacterium]|nr:C40 family peptidase [Clostridiales bacterium]